ncbi:methylthioribose kinase [Alkalihalobacillus sp. FSL W8-0930]
MIQRFIELGEGYGDFYELLELATTNKERLAEFVQFETNINDQKRASVGVILRPATKAGFMPIYYCREGISIKEGIESKRVREFRDLAHSLHKRVRQLEVRPSKDFAEKELYEQYLTGVFRVNHCLPPLNW